MRATRPLPVVLVAPLAAVGLLLAGCSGDAEPDATATEDEPAATADADATEEPEAEEPEAEEPAVSSGAGCVAGTWVSDPEAQEEATTSALGMSELGAEATVTGDSLTTFADGTMTTQYRDMVVEVTWGMEGQELRMVNSWSGTVTGAAEVTDEQIVISDVDASALELSYETFINGELVDIPGMAEIPLSGFAAGGTSTYTCDGDELRMTPVVEGLDTSTMVTVLHRQD